MQRQTRTTHEDRTPLAKANDQLAEGLPERAKPVTAIPWFFYGLAVIAVIAMVLFIVMNRH